MNRKQNKIKFQKYRESLKTKKIANIKKKNKKRKYRLEHNKTQENEDQRIK